VHNFIYLFIYLSITGKGRSHLHAGKINYNERLHVIQCNKTKQLYNTEIK